MTQNDETPDEFFFLRPGSTDAERNEPENHRYRWYSRSQVLSTGWWSEDALDNTGEVVVATGLTESPIFSEAEGRIYRNPPMNGEQIRSPLNCELIQRYVNAFLHIHFVRTRVTWKKLYGGLHFGRIGAHVV